MCLTDAAQRSNASCALFLKYGSGEEDSVSVWSLTEQPSNLYSCDLELRSERSLMFWPIFKTHESHFHVYSSVYHKERQKSTSDLSKGQKTSYWTVNEAPMDQWLRRKPWCFELLLKRPTTWRWADHLLTQSTLTRNNFLLQQVPLRLFRLSYSTLSDSLKYILYELVSLFHWN